MSKKHSLLFLVLTVIIVVVSYNISKFANNGTNILKIPASPSPSVENSKFKGLQVKRSTTAICSNVRLQRV